MSKQAGPGPFALIYHEASEIVSGGHPCHRPFIWPWDEPLPEGWAVCPIVMPVAPEPDNMPGREALDEIACTEKDIFDFSNDAEMAREADRLCAQAECKDMAYKLMGMLREMPYGVAADAFEIAQQLHEALPDGSGE